MAEHSHKMSPKLKLKRAVVFSMCGWKEHPECVIITDVSAWLPKRDRCEYI